MPGKSLCANQCCLWESSHGCGRLAERSAGVRGSWPAARLCPSKAFEMRAPVSRPHPNHHAPIYDPTHADRG